MDSYDDGQSWTGYPLCDTVVTTATGTDTCDRRRGHHGAHTWQMKVPSDPPPHGCLEDRIAALEAKVAQLERKQAQGPDPRLWSGDPHDGGGAYLNWR